MRRYAAAVGCSSFFFVLIVRRILHLFHAERPRVGDPPATPLTQQTTDERERERILWWWCFSSSAGHLAFDLYIRNIQSFRFVFDILLAFESANMTKMNDEFYTAHLPLFCQGMATLGVRATVYSMV